MTAGARCLIHGVALMSCLKDLLCKLMAGLTEKGFFIYEIILMPGTVRIVAGEASVIKRFMAF